MRNVVFTDEGNVRTDKMKYTAQRTLNTYTPHKLTFNLISSTGIPVNHKSVRIYTTSQSELNLLSSENWPTVISIKHPVIKKKESFSKLSIILHSQPTQNTNTIEFLAWYEHLLEKHHFIQHFSRPKTSPDNAWNSRQFGTKPPQSVVSNWHVHYVAHNAINLSFSKHTYYCVQWNSTIN